MMVGPQEVVMCPKHNVLIERNSVCEACLGEDPIWPIAYENDRGVLRLRSHTKSSRPGWEEE